MTAVLRCLCSKCNGIVYLRCADYFDAHPDTPIVIEHRSDRPTPLCVLSPEARR